MNGESPGSTEIRVVSIAMMEAAKKSWFRKGEQWLGSPASPWLGDG